MRWFVVFLILARAACADIVNDVRVAAAQGNLPLGDSLINGYRGQRGVTPEMLEALSWLARGALELKQLDRAEGYARETETQVRAQLRRRALDSDPHLPMALGAAIEVQGQVLAGRGERSEALALLRKDLLAFSRTSIRARIQKNINLLTLEGKPAPPLDEREFLGSKPVALAALQGKPVLLFFWAHWCGDCKGEGPLIAQLRREYGAKGLTIIAPTQRYGYVAGGQDAPPQQELQYIDAVRHHFYSDLLDVPAPISEENFKLYGASTTPTLVLIDRRGIVRLYHPGAMRMEELRAAVNSVL
jgi:thiol-disulfide isomerase/thioredoxin